MTINLEQLRDAARGARPASQAPATLRTPVGTPIATACGSAHPETTRSSSNWFWWLIAVVAVLWFFDKSDDKKPSTTGKPPAAAQATASDRPSQGMAASKPHAESKPPAGQGLLLMLPQLRYCIFERMRIEGARSALNLQFDADVDRFNAWVDEFNSRCSSYKYKTTDLEAVSQEVQSNQDRLLAEGRRRFVAARASSGARTAPVAMVRAIQVRLSQLGYSPGPADGQVGRATREAIMAFQRDRGMAVTGVADQGLMDRLQQVATGRLH